MPGVLTVGLNDDEAERRKRRLRTNIGTIMSPGCHTPKFGQSAQSSIRYGVGTQLAPHMHCTIVTMGFVM